MPPLGPPPPYAFYVLILPILAAAPIVLFVFYLNSNLYPLRGRAPFLSLGSSILWCIILIHEILVLYLKPYPCAARQLTASVTYTNIMCIQIYRILYYLFEHHINSSISSTSIIPGTNYQSFKNNQNKNNWYVKHCNIIHSKTIRKFFLVINFLQICFVILLFSVSVNTTKFFTGPCLPSYTQLLWFSHLHAAIWIFLSSLGLILICMIYRLSNDSLWFKTELAITTVGIGSAVIIYIAWLFTPVMPRWGITIPMIFGGYCQIFASIAYPYYLSKKEKDKKNNHNRITPVNSKTVSPSLRRRLSLMEVLDDCNGFELFLTFLKTEFSAENLLFWKAVQHLKNMGSDCTLHELETCCFNIWSQFLIEHAPYPVDLPYEIRYQLGEKSEDLQELPPALEDLQLAEIKISSSSTPSSSPQSHSRRQEDLQEIKKRDTLLHFYDDAQQAAYNSMNNDSFLRFKNQEEFIQYSLHTSSQLQPSSRANTIIFDRETPTPTSMTPEQSKLTLG